MKVFMRCPILFGLILASTMLVDGCSSKSPPEPILIGQLAPQTGPEKIFGDQVKNGTALAVEEARENPIAGRPVQVIQADDRGNPEAVAAVAGRLVTFNKVVALLAGIEAAESEELAGVARDYKVPVVLPGSPPARSMNEYVFSTAPAPADLGRLLARFTLDDLKLKQIAVLTAAVETRGPEMAARASSLSEGFLKECRKSTISVAESTYRLISDLKDKPLVERLKSSKAEVLFLAGTASDLVELRQAGLDVPVILAGPEGSLPVLQGNDKTGVVFLATLFAADDAKVQGFVRTYQERFGMAPNVHAGLAYDNTRLLIEAVRQAKTIDSAGVRQALADLKSFEGLTGTISRGEENRTSRPVFIIKVENGQAKTVKRFEPES